MTEHQITYDGERINYVLERKPIKNINLRVKSDGSVYVSAPSSVPERRIDAFVIQQVPFIQRARFTWEQRKKIRPQIPDLQLVSGEKIEFLGRSVFLKVVYFKERKKGRVVYPGENFLYLHVREGATFEQRKKVLDEFWKELGTYVFNHWSQVVFQRFMARGLDVPQAKIKQQSMKSRWGSCIPSKGIIKMNLRMLRGPQHFIEYVMVHEYSHFIHPNHSPRFHNLVASFLPNWKRTRKELNEYFYNKPY